MRKSSETAEIHPRREGHRKARIGFSAVILSITLCGLAVSGSGAPPALHVRPDGVIEQGDMLTRYWRVNHMSPADLAAEVESYFEPRAKTKVSVSAYSAYEVRIVTPKERWPAVKLLLDVLDVPAPQVHVSARVVEIEHDSDLQVGVDAGYDRLTAAKATQTFFGSFTGTFDPASYLDSLGSSTPFEGGTFSFDTVGNAASKHGNVNVVLRMLQKRGSADLLAAPSFLVEQGKQATVQSAFLFPTAEQLIYTNYLNVQTKFIPVGLTLKVTPMLVGRNFVKLDISFEDSQITDSVPGPLGLQNPVVTSRSVKTRVVVRDGETLILGSPLIRSIGHDKSGLPILSDLPGISQVTSATRSQGEKDEIVFFIRAEVVKPAMSRVILPPAERRRLTR